MTRHGRQHADEALLLALACGATVEQAAAKANIAPRTAHRRLKKPDFLRRLREFKDEMVKRAAGMLTAAAMESVKTSLGLQEPKNPPAVRLGAARAVLEMGIRMREVSD